MIYRYGSEGAAVQQIQERLQVVVDGFFGRQTEAAVMDFQRNDRLHPRLHVDGVVGALTWRAMFGRKMDLWRPEGPLLQREVAEWFGDPHESSFNTSYICFLNLNEFQPHFSHIRSWQTFRGFGFEAHYLMEEPLKAALGALVQAGGARDLQTWDGCHVVRYMRGTSGLSMHAFGLAVDFNEATNPLNGAGDMSPRVIRAFAGAGFEYGGLWRKPHDPMHFQLAWTRDWRKLPGSPAGAPAPPEWG